MADGGTAHGPRTIDQLAAQLADDHVIVDQVLGSGRTAEVDARLTRLADRVRQETGTTVYVVAVEAPTDTPSDEPSSDLAVALPRRLGDGVYLVDCGEGVPQVAVRGSDIDETRFSLLKGATLDRVSGDDQGSLLPPAVQGETVLRLVRHQDPRMMTDGPYGDGDTDRYGFLPDAQLAPLRELAVLTARPSEPTRSSGLTSGDEPATTGDLALWGATSGVLVLVVAYLSLRRAWPGTRGLAAHLRRRPAGLDPGERERLEAQTRRNLDELVRRIAAAPAEPPHPAALERAVAAREVVEHLLPVGDERELVGALTLTRIGLGDVRSATQRREQPWRPCFVDPLHGEAETESAFELEDATLEVPVCGDCATRLRRGRPLRPFRPDGPSRGRPYYAADDVWARTGFGALDGEVAHTVLRDRAGRR